MDQEIMEQLRTLKPNYPNIRRLRLFGSAVKGRMDKDSDIDLLVDFKQVPDLFEIGGMVTDFEERLGKKVDLVMTDALIPELRDIILSEAVDVE